MSDLLEIFIFAASIMAEIFNALDNVYLGSHSMLDISIGLYVLERTFWFIFKVLGQSPGPDSGSIPDDYDVWGVTDEMQNDSDAYEATRLHYQKQQWTDRDDGKRDSGFEYDGSGKLRRMLTVKR